MTQPKKPKELPRNHISSDTYGNGYNQAIDEMEAYYKPILDSLVKDLTSCVGLIRGTYPMVNSLALLERCEDRKSVV